MEELGIDEIRDTVRELEEYIERAHKKIDHLAGFASLLFEQFEALAYAAGHQEQANAAKKARQAFLAKQADVSKKALEKFLPE